MSRPFEQPMSRAKTWGLRVAGALGLVVAVVSPFTGPSVTHRVVGALAGLFMSGCLFMTLGRKWNVFAFAVTGVGMLGFAGVYGLALLAAPHRSGPQLAWGCFLMFAIGFFALCVVVGGIRWARTGSPFPGGEVDPRVASGPFAEAASAFNRRRHVNAQFSEDDSTT